VLRLKTSGAIPLLIPPAFVAYT